MTFNKCSINGKSYGDIVDESTGEVASAEDVSEKVLFDLGLKIINDGATSTPPGVKVEHEVQSCVY